jgi:uncharacterized membrane protein
MTWGRILLWVVLGVSLLANAVVLGLALRFGAFSEDAGWRSGWGTLPAEARGYFRSELAENRSELRTMVSSLREARSEVFAAAAARPYDRAAVEAAQAKVRALTSALQIKGQEMLLDAFDKAAAVGP